MIETMRNSEGSKYNSWMQIETKQENIQNKSTSLSFLAPRFDGSLDGTHQRAEFFDIDFSITIKICVVEHWCTWIVLVDLLSYIGCANGNIWTDTICVTAIGAKSTWIAFELSRIFDKTGIGNINTNWINYRWLSTATLLTVLSINEMNTK